MHLYDISFEGGATESTSEDSDLSDKSENTSHVTDRQSLTKLL